ncbi:PAS domain S-box protein [Thermodesulfobacteriota bacterium]
MKSKPNRQPINSYRRKILLFFSLMQLLLLAIVCTSIHIVENRGIHETSVANAQKVMNVFLSDIDHEKRILTGILPSVTDDPAIIQAWQDRDREALLASSMGLFENLRQRFRVTHFYFHELDSVNFLRVHAPDRHGDLIKRYTLEEARLQNQDSAGIELGPLGTFALRLVSPWIINGRLAGYVELGMEIDHITQHLEESHDLNLALVIQKSYLNRQAWEDGQQIFSRNGSWDTYKDFMITEIRSAPLPPNMMQMKKLQDHQSPAMLPFNSGGKRFCSVFLPLLDAGNREVGYMVCIKDYSERYGVLQQLLLLVTSVFVIVGTVLFVGFNFIMEYLESARLKAEESLQASETELRSIVESSATGITVSDLRGKIVRINPAHQKMLGYSSDELNKLYFSDLTHPDDIGKHQTSYEQLIAGEIDHFGMNKRFIHKDGHSIWAQVTVSLVRDQQNKPLLVVGMVEDITERKKLAGEKEKLIAELQVALDEVKVLRGIIPICSSCKQIRDDKGYWNQIESYIGAHSEAQFSHGICPDCAKKLYPDWVDEGD